MVITWGLNDIWKQLLFLKEASISPGIKIQKDYLDGVMQEQCLYELVFPPLWNKHRATPPPNTPVSWD